ncbi:hypothetical protein [Nibribacter koreensis]|uniref:hypothetical protein n=1 Tax=Nibribacter koreensis TaxID=1084519 RepID=UPI0031F14E08
MQALVHYSLLVAILLASMGFKVAVTQCAGKGETSIGFFSEPGCCCKKAAKEPMKECGDMSCVMQRSVALQSTFGSSSRQVAKAVKVQEQIASTDYTYSIRLVVLQALPVVILPPPITGRDLSILHQTFLL